MNTNGRPNIIFFMVDQMGAKWLEAAMNGICDLPNLRRLQAMGTTFDHAFSNNPVCCPARATIATGLSSQAHGLLSNGFRLNPDIPTFMKTLQSVGWRTGAFGKIHFYPFDSEYYPYPDYREYGWDVVHNTEDNRTGEWHEWVRDEHPEHYEGLLSTPATWAKELPYYDSYGAEKVNLTEKMHRAKDNMRLPEGAHGGWGARGFSYFPLPFPEELSQTNWITDHALGFIRETPAQQPLYTHISYVQPHPPFHTPARFLERVKTALIPEPVGGGESCRVVPDWREMRKYYFADFMHIDEQIGRVLDVLETTGRLANSYLVFTSDHGEMLGDHNRLSKSQNHYDPVYRIPLIIAGPGIERCAVCEAFVQHEDICPTILDMDEMLINLHPRPLIRREFLEQETPRFNGRSLMPWCRGETVNGWRTSALIESFGCICEGPNCTRIRKSWKKTLRNSEFRYSMIVGHDEEELIDLARDPDEQTNVAGDPRYGDALVRMRHDMLKRLAMQDFPLPPRDLVVIGAH